MVCGPMERPFADNPTEFSVDICWKKADGAIEYKLYQRKIPDEWDKAKVIKISDPNQTKHVADDLEPTSTYQYRITVVTAEGESEPSPETTIDTAVGNCTPKPKCVIM